MGFSRKGGQHDLNLILQCWKVSIHGIPDSRRVNAKIVMYQNISHSSNLRPGNLRVVLLNLRRESASGFANDLKVVYHPRLNQFIILKDFKERLKESLRQIDILITTHGIQVI